MLSAREEALRIRHLKDEERWSEHTKRLQPLVIGDQVRICKGAVMEYVLILSFGRGKCKGAEMEYVLILCVCLFVSFCSCFVLQEAAC